MPIPQTAKQAAINIAKQTARESNEFVKAAREQVAPTESQKSSEEPKADNRTQNEEKDRNKEGVAKLREHSSFMGVYRQELEQIRKDNLFKELQKKISEGEEIPLANYVKELTSEQREVLKAQMEAVRIRREQEEEAKKKNTIPRVVSKKGRQMFFMFKKRNEQHVETRQPPSS